MESGQLFKSPPLPLAVTVPILLVTLVILLLALRQSRGLVTWFLLIAVWVRVTSGAFYEITFAPIVGGLSLNAFLSVATVAAGLVVIPLRTLKMPWAVPILGVIAVVVISGLFNRTFGGMIDMALKWSYALVLIAAIVRAMALNGQTRTLTLLLYCFAPLFLCQAASIALGVVKQGEGDGSASYVGGYAHEATFSVMALGFAFTAYLARGISPQLRFALIAVGTIAVILSNYRTSVIAVLPILVAFGIVSVVSAFRPEQRRVIAAFIIPVSCLLIGLVLSSDGLMTRFGDIFRFLGDPLSFVKPRNEFTELDGKVLSGRLAIWVGYIEGYLEGTGLQALIGLGPNSWQGIMAKYAHNTVVSFLYELGPVGVVALLLVWGTFVQITLRIPDKTVRIQFMAAQIGFLLLNMATMPHWQIEGNILFAVLQATVLFELQRGIMPTMHSTPLGLRPSPIMPSRMASKPPPRLRYE